MRAKSASKYLEHRDQKRELDIHYSRLEKIMVREPRLSVNHVRRPSIQNQSKSNLFFTNEMKRNNNILKKCLRSIDDKGGRYNQTAMANTFFKPLSSNQEIMRIKKNREIDEENKKIFFRIESAKKNYDVERWKLDNEKKDDLILSLQENARRLNPFIRRKRSSLSGDFNFRKFSGQF